MKVLVWLWTGPLRAAVVPADGVEIAPAETVLRGVPEAAESAAATIASVALAVGGGGPGCCPAGDGTPTAGAAS